MEKTAIKPVPAAQPLILNNTQVVALFGVTPMTIYAWRNNSVGGRSPLPVRTGKKVVGLSYDGQAVVKWATKHGVPLAASLAKVAKMASEAKPRGPKPRAQA